MIRLRTLTLSIVIGSIFLYAAAPSAVDGPIVLTQIPSGGTPRGTPQLTGIPACDKARISILDPGGSLRPLTEGFYGACDPEVSFDGQRILFAGKRTADDDWNVYEIGSNGSGLRQITRGLGDCRSPLYLSTLYTLISDKPWNQIAFVSNMAKVAGEYGQWPATAIYSTRLDGTGLMRLTHGPSGDLDPFQMQDGRLLFAGWRPRLPDRPARMPLFAVNIDGTDFMLFADGEGRPCKRTPCVTSTQLAVFVESEQPRADGAGNLACVSLRRNLYSYRQITKPGEGLFLYPSPMPNGQILVSRRSEDGKGTFGIHVVDPVSGSIRQLFDDTKYEDIQARILAPRLEPDGRSTSVLRRTGEIEDPHALEPQDKKSGPRELPSGRLYCFNVYNSNLFSKGALPKGTVKRVRVLEGLLPPAVLMSAHKGTSARDADSRGAAGVQTLKRRFIGEAPVEADGSFNLHVPANIPIEVQILDSDGLSLASCSWIWVKNNEPRGCIGCHEDPELVPENQLVAALAKPSLELVLPAERRRSVDFVHDVKPIIQARCIACHQAGRSKPRLDDRQDPARIGWSAAPDVSYGILLNLEQRENPGKVGGTNYITPGRARTSPLIWHLLGRNTSQPWDVPAPAAAFKPMPPADKARLSADERRVFVEWIDTGAQWDGQTSQGETPARRTSRGEPKP